MARKIRREYNDQFVDSNQDNYKRRGREKRGNDNIFSPRMISPKTIRQALMIDAYNNGKNVLAVGSAGTGKSFISCYLALESLLRGEVDKIIIVRSSVNIRNQGFLPGTLDEKEMIYTLPYKAIFDDICQCGTAWDTLTKKGLVKFLSSSYIRGITLENCIVIVDEIQNIDQSECESILTRIGENCQVIICGDTRQNDLFRKKEVSCFEWLLKLSNKLKNYFEVVNFTSDDIVRSELCKAIIMAIEDGV